MRQALLAVAAAMVVVLGVMNVRAPRTELLVGSHVIRENKAPYNHQQGHVVQHQAPAMSQVGTMPSSCQLPSPSALTHPAHETSR